MKKYKLLALCVISITFAKAQKYVELAKSCNEVFPDQEVVISESKVEMTFKAVKGKPQAIESVEEFVVCTNSGNKFHYAVFYDDNSSIDKFSGFYSSIKDNYSTDGIFHSDLKIMAGVRNFYNFGEGFSVKYLKSYKDLKYLTKINFVSRFKTLEKEIKITIPEAFDVEIVERNFDGFGIVSNKVIEGKNTVYTYKLEEVENYRAESNQPGPSFIYPHVLLLVKEYSKGNDTEFFKTTADQYNWYKNLVDEIGNETETIEPIVKQLIEGKKTDQEKIESIFYWVQDNIKYIAFEDGIAGFKPASCQEVYSNLYGDCKGMANLTKEMLILAGYDARLVWLGTRRIAYDYSMPTLAADNHMICALRMDGQYIYLDPTEKFIAYKEIAERIQDRPVMIEDGNTYVLSSVNKNSPNQNYRKIKMQLDLNEDLSMNGEVEMAFSGEYKSYFLDLNKKVKKKDKEYLLQQVLSTGENKIKTEDLEIENLTQGKTPVRINGNLTIEDVASEFDGEIYIYMDPFQFYGNSKIDVERKSDYWMSFKKMESLEISVAIPEGLLVESIPEPMQIEQEGYAFEGSFNLKDNTIHYSLHAKFTSSILKKEDFIKWNKILKTIQDFYEQPIILKRK